jgi:hypothetical protein
MDLSKKKDGALSARKKLPFRLFLASRHQALKQARVLHKHTEFEHYCQKEKMLFKAHIVRSTVEVLPEE